MQADKDERPDEGDEKLLLLGEIGKELEKLSDDEVEELIAVLLLHIGEDGSSHI